MTVRRLATPPRPPTTTTFTFSSRPPLALRAASQPSHQWIRRDPHRQPPSTPQPPRSTPPWLHAFSFPPQPPSPGEPASLRSPAGRRIPTATSRVHTSPILQWPHEIGFGRRGRDSPAVDEIQRRHRSRIHRKCRVQLIAAHCEAHRGSACSSRPPQQAPSLFSSTYSGGARNISPPTNGVSSPFLLSGSALDLLLFAAAGSVVLVAVPRAYRCSTVGIGHAVRQRKKNVDLFFKSPVIVIFMCL